MRILRNKKGEGYVDIVVAVLVIVFLLLTIISVWKMIVLKQDMHYMCEKILEAATMKGNTGPEVNARYEVLCSELGFRPTMNVTADYYSATDKTVQLGDPITIKLTYRMHLQGLGGFQLPFDVTVTKSGLSKVYWK